MTDPSRNEEKADLLDEINAVEELKRRLANIPTTANQLVLRVAIAEALNALESASYWLGRAAGANVREKSIPEQETT